MATHKEPTDAEVAAEAAAMYPDTNAGPPTPDEIAAEAHAIYLNRGGGHGHDVEDWLEAERRLKARPGGSDVPTGWRERDANRRSHGDDDLKS